MTEQSIPLVELRGVSKVYPNGIAANRGLDLTVYSGEIHALTGENGAGKTTLMKLLFGMEQPTAGEIRLRGERVTITSPADAIARGIGMVHQHFMLVPSLTVAENVVLGMAPRRAGFLLDRAEARRITAEAAERFRLPVDPDARVAEVPVGMKQKVEILKALVRGAKLLILDEPTAVLTAQETQELFAQLRHLKTQGYTVIFISHKLDEVLSLCDRITVLRAGRTQGTFDAAGVTPQELSRRMIGRDVLLAPEHSPARPGRVVLRVRELSCTGKEGKMRLDALSFDLRAGEILGVAGVEGNGQKELVDLLFGFAAPDGGSIQIYGRDACGLSPRALRKRGVSLIPEDRMLNGIAASASIEENLISTRTGDPLLCRAGVFSAKRMHTLVDRLIGEYRVLCRSRRQQVQMLSGGNIQKIVVAREFSGAPRLLIADQPTRGIDVGATEFIRAKLLEMARAGTAVLLVSADLSEILELSDRLMVLCGGRAAAVFDHPQTLTGSELGEYMLGLRRQSAQELGGLCHE